jgi:hypothetical protein
VPGFSGHSCKASKTKHSEWGRVRASNVNGLHSRVFRKPLGGLRLPRGLAFNQRACCCQHAFARRRFGTISRLPQCGTARGSFSTLENLAAPDATPSEHIAASCKTAP